MAELTNRVAIVTGASKGIGAGIARAFAETGAAVVVNYAGAGDDAERVVADIAASGGRAMAIRADVSRRTDIERLFAETLAAFGPRDIIVNNAGVFSFQPLAEIVEAEFHRQFDVNVLGAILVAQEAVKHFPVSGGAIINIGSTASANPEKNATIYAATKAAVDAVTRTLADELGPAASASIVSRPAASRPKARAPMASWAAKPNGGSWRRRRSVASGNPPISAGSRCSLPRMPPDGSPASASSSAAGFASHVIA